jgi:DNA helicase II / ATP-dependent DNA helicase PcrA
VEVLAPPPEAPQPAEQPWLAQLNPEQRAAATHSGGPLLILAGAGTGKTTTLSARVAWLIAQGTPPERIMLLTFTRRAAREMLERVATMTGLGGGRGSGGSASAKSRVLGGTFHSIAHRFVRLHAASLGLAPGFAVLDPGDAADVLDLIREEQGRPARQRRFPRPGTLLDIYSRTVNCQRPLSEVVAESFPWCEAHVDALGELFRAYGARKRALGALDLDDLLLYWRALALDEVIGPAMEDGFDHVLIDEYQDVNGLQVEIVSGLRGTRRQLTVVGDDLQAIYAWRAASAEHILSFGDRFPDASLLKLERNYRSREPILDTANALSGQFARAYRKRLRTRLSGGTRSALVFCRDESAQAIEVCERVLDAREQGADLRRQAVLMRTSHDSDLLELELSRRQIPFVKYGGLRYLEAAHVKDLIALFRLLHNPASELSWFRVLQLLDGVGPVTARRAMDPLIRSNLAGWPESRERLPEAVRGAADALVEALVTARAAASAGAAAEALRDALAPLIETRYPDGAMRLQDLDHMIAAARESSDLGHFTAELTLDAPQSSAGLAGPPHLDEDYLVLSTVHSAKGLEWESVHVLALYDGNFPADMACGSPEGVEEERRLLYVAVTRARQRLYLYVPVRYYHRPKGRDDAHGYGKASRFLTGEVQATCEVIMPPWPQSAPSGAVPQRQISVSVADLWR